MSGYDASGTLSPNNQFKFVCPVFKVETKIATCFKLRDMVYMGKRPEQRVGCQVCIHTSKCPVPHILNEMVRTGDDPYYSATEKAGQLHPRHVARIARIQVLPKYLEAWPVSEKERALLLKANEDAKSQSRLTPDTATGRFEDIQEPVRRTRRKKVEAESAPERRSSLADAMARGSNLATAVNRMMEESEA